MSIEEKAKAYDEALKRARAMYDVNYTDSYTKANLETIFPELRESEDERIRKDIRLVIESAATKYFKKTGKIPEWYDRIVAYLEKPEQKPIATINGEPIPTENHSVDIPLAEWSEEDEIRLTNTLIMLKEYAIHHYSKDDVSKSVDWLENKFKSLRPNKQD